MQNEVQNKKYALNVFLVRFIKHAVLMQSLQNKLLVGRIAWKICEDILFFDSSLRGSTYHESSRSVEASRPPSWLSFPHMSFLLPVPYTRGIFMMFRV